MVCLYFNEPDHAGHVYGANSKEVNKQIKISDDVLGYLLKSLKKLDIYNKVNVVIVSDHGMVDVSKDKVINIDNFNFNAILDGKGPIMSVREKEIGSINTSKINIPHVSIISSKNNNELHYHNPLYDFLLIADEGWMLYQNKHIDKYNGELPVNGMHGYDSDSINMHAIFYAHGPKFLNGITIDTFELIHIYPMLCELLGIVPYNDIDGTLEVLKPILR